MLVEFSLEMNVADDYVLQTLIMRAYSNVRRRQVRAQEMAIVRSCLNMK